MAEPRPAIKKLRQRKERHQQRSRPYRIAFGAVAVLVILAGIALIPLPGPGWLIVAVGLGMLALEFDRAERLLERILDRLEETRESLSRTQQLALLGLGAVAAVAWVTATILWEIPVLPG